MVKPYDYRVRAALALVRVSGERETLEGLHHAIELEIAKRVKRIDEAHASGNQEFDDAVTNDECSQIEELLGLAFVAAQSFITAVRARWTMIAPVCRDEYAINFSFSIGPKGSGLLRESPVLPIGSPYHAVEVINAVANYWKHVDEWPTTWMKNDETLKTVWDLASMQNNNEKRTVEIAIALGMSAGSSGNLRDAASSLGITQYSNLSVIRKVLFDWAECLYEKAKNEVQGAVQESDI